MRKVTEIRVNDSSRRKIKEGSLIRFRCQGDQILTRVTRVARYSSFEEMFDHESVASVNPLATRDEQLANIRQIYPPNVKLWASWRSASNWSTRPRLRAANPHSALMGVEQVASERVQGLALAELTRSSAFTRGRVR